jgi:hypothetical protein
MEMNQKFNVRDRITRRLHPGGPFWYRSEFTRSGERIVEAVDRENDRMQFGERDFLFVCET